MTLTPPELRALSLLATLSAPYRPIRGGPVAARTLAPLVPLGLVQGTRGHERRGGKPREFTAYRITEAGRAML